MLDTSSINIYNLGEDACKLIIKTLKLDMSVEDIFNQITSTIDSMTIWFIIIGVITCILAWTGSRFIQAAQGFVCGAFIANLGGIVLSWFDPTVTTEFIHEFSMFAGLLGAIIGITLNQLSILLNCSITGIMAGILIFNGKFDIIMSMLLGLVLGIIISVIMVAVKSVSAPIEYAVSGAIDFGIAVTFRTGNKALGIWMFILFAVGSISIYYLYYNKLYRRTPEEKRKDLVKLKLSNMFEIKDEKYYRHKRLVKSKKISITVLVVSAVILLMMVLLPKSKTYMYHYYMIRASYARTNNEKESLYDIAKSYRSDKFNVYKRLAELYSQDGSTSNVNNEIEEATNIFGADDKRVNDLINELTVSVPVFSVNSGDYTESQVVRLTASENNKIVYSIKSAGSVVSESDNKDYISPINLDSDGTYKISARTVTPEGYTSELVTNTYTLDLNFPGQVKADIESGDYEEPIKVKLSSDEGYILYTTDGTIPNNTSKLYNGALNVGLGVTTINSVTVNAKGKMSKVSSDTYRISYYDPASTTKYSSGFSGYFYDYICNNGVISVRSKTSNKEVDSLSGQYPNEYNDLMYYKDKDGIIEVYDPLTNASKVVDTNIGSIGMMVVEHNGIYYTPTDNKGMKFYSFDSNKSVKVLNEDETVVMMMRCQGMLYFVSNSRLARIEKPNGVPVELVKCGSKVKEENEKLKKLKIGLNNTEIDNSDELEVKKTNNSDDLYGLKSLITEKDKQYVITDVYTKDNKNIYYIEDGALYYLDYKNNKTETLIDTKTSFDEKLPSGWKINDDGTVTIINEDGTYGIWRNNNSITYPVVKADTTDNSDEADVDDVNERVVYPDYTSLPWVNKSNADSIIKRYTDLRSLADDAVEKRTPHIHDLNGAIQNEDGTFTLTDGSILYTDGTIVETDGTIVSPTGSIAYADGTMVYEDGTVKYTDGTTVAADGTSTFTNGTVVDSDKNIHYSDGSVIGIDNLRVFTDGHKEDAYGNIYNEDGTITYKGPTSSNIQNYSLNEINLECIGLQGSHNTLIVRVKDTETAMTVDYFTNKISNPETSSSEYWDLVSLTDNKTSKFDSPSEYIFFVDNGYYSNNNVFNNYSH